LSSLPREFFGVERLLPFEENVQPASAVDGLRRGERPTSNAQLSMKEARCSSSKLRRPRVVIDIFVLQLGGELGGEVVHLDDDGANASNQEIVTEHRRDRDA